MALHRLHRFLVTPEEVGTGRLRLTGTQARHAAVVLRLRPGDRLLAFDGRGREYLVELERCAPGQVEGRVVESKTAGAALPVHLTLVQGLTRGAKMDLIIRMGVEVGIDTFIPMASERTVARAHSEGRIQRWQRIAREASQQAGRPVVPEIRAILSFDDALRAVGEDDLRLMPWEGERARTIGAVLAATRRARRVAVFIGPEGGFSPGEAARAAAAGVTPVSLGPLILRTETAGLVAAAMIVYELTLRPAE